MKHCIHCGGKTKQENSKYTCQKCGKTFYENPKATVAIILFTPDKKQFIFGIRAYEPHKGMLDSIGGFLDPGETFEAAAYREIQEEIGIDKKFIGEFMYLGSGADPYTWEGEVVAVTGVYFLAELKEGAVVKPADDVAGVAYCNVNDIDTYQHKFAWQSMEKNIKKAAQLLAEM